MNFTGHYSLPYLFGGMWIAIWWAAAFYGFSSNPNFSLIPPQDLAPMDATLNRVQLQKALQGDVAVIEALLIKWHLKTQALKEEGISPTYQLETSELLEALLLSEILGKTDEKPPQKFLAQTYPSACFLLSLLLPNNITAIPDGFQHQTQFYDSSFLEKIPLNRSLFSLEALWKAKPAAAFISPYSNPAFVSALHRLQIPCLLLPHAYQIKQVENVLQTIGFYTASSRKAKLLSLFMKAALHAIDTKISEAYFRAKKNLHSLKPLLLFHHLQFTAAAKHTLAGEFMDRLRFQNFTHSSITSESLKKLDPDLLIIASQNGETSQRELTHLPLFTVLKVAKLNRIFWVDSSVQQSASQFCVLAYYDLACPIIACISEER
ncbi:ABC transporter substrate-binding protein [Parachlamydia sp. AcF125]|uniref:ABC transporter substrate-binding protein n=1 Tax=Parachlamydia sp. AcF125 TaxID=2795736 RepID=UPI001BC990E2|nr:ABC transporter substrate-binding protein [Parachlamydia sp. AcF125]MBS4169017.1 hypothetical protein [Parachlamydia sp. AcF125]